MSQDDADLTLAYWLRDIVRFLPRDTQARYFHDHRNQVHIRTNQLRATQKIPYEHAFYRAADDVLPGSWREIWELVWDERHELLRQARGDLRRRLTRQPEPERYTHPEYGPANAIRNNPRLLSRLRSYYGEAVVAELCWHRHYCNRPDEYLGCVETNGRLVFAVAMEVWPSHGGPRTARRLYQLGRLLNWLTYERVIGYWEVDLVDVLGRVDPHVSFVAEHWIYWNDHEGLVFPSAFASPTDQDALSQQIHALCGNWLVSQGVQHTVQLSIDDF